MARRFLCNPLWVILMSVSHKNVPVVIASGRLTSHKRNEVIRHDEWQHELPSKQRNLDSDFDGYGRIYSDDADVSACIQIPDNHDGDLMDGMKLVLGDCDATEYNDKWRMDGGGLIHAQRGHGHYCMQAGHGGPAKSGEFVRLYKCDASSQLQRFVFINGGGIRPKSNRDLCVVWQGVHANIGKDNIILKECQDVPERNDWSPSADFHQTDDDKEGDDYSDMGDSNDSDDDDRSPCVDRSISEFIIEDNIDIGDTLLHSDGPGFAEKCGPDCYTVKDNGDDPPYDPELGDTLRFAYKTVTSNEFSIQARVCGVDCDSGGSGGGYYGRTGLMIRESLDPLAANIFVSHQANGQSDYSYRALSGEETIYGFDGSPDVPCLWIHLSRNGNTFESAYAYDKGSSPCGRESFEAMEWLNLTVPIEMGEEVYVGLAVSTGLAPPFCQYTEADFENIECRGC